MMIHDAHLVSIAAADDAAFEALIDLTTVLEGRDETAVIGGHMVELITAAFPSPGLVARRTQDADAGIPVALARSGDVHDGLVAMGYTPAGGNRYVRGDVPPQPTIDVLVPTLEAAFGEVQLGGRWFNEMPGLGLGTNPTLRIRAHLTFRNGAERVVEVTVPHLEGAIILKAFAWRDRHRQSSKDGVDLSNLFAVLRHHAESGFADAWRLNEPSVRGLRRDAAAVLHDLADLWDVRPPAGPVDAVALVSRIRTWVTDPR